MYWLTLVVLIVVLGYGLRTSVLYQRSDLLIVCVLGFLWWSFSVGWEVRNWRTSPKKS